MKTKIITLLHRNLILVGRPSVASHVHSGRNSYRMESNQHVGQVLKRMDIVVLQYALTQHFL